MKTEHKGEERMKEDETRELKDILQGEARSE
jgi:hypothetical protein